MGDDNAYSADRARSIFLEALERQGAPREAFLQDACGSNRALRTRVETLLQNHQEDSFLEQPALLPLTVVPSESVPSDEPGTLIGRYKLLQKIGEGGCGIVYMAEQTEPVRRRVALKVIKLGMDTRSVIARFEAERQALAMMDHPNIAKVLDGGATEAGRPYFVMELVRGVKITEYCDEARLSTHERLELFIQVCQAIQHAHQKGIIHRDLKPSNILVTVNDGVPLPKVIDFGIAKATNQQQLTDKTVFTAFEQFIGTPAYMSPEQAVMTSLDVDTRSDIYSLGVLLYEMLTGTTPFDARELVKAGFDEMRRIIRETEPEKPSTRLTQRARADATRLSTGSEFRDPKSEIEQDLDWIVMKCLEKDRTRRYETASGLAHDVQRHLGNEPIIARPPSAVYRFQKAIRRHKVAFASVAAVTTTLMLGLGVSTWQAVRARVAEQEQSRLRLQSQASEREAREAEREQTSLRRQAEASEQATRTEAAKSEQVARFLTDVLEGVGPSVALGRDTTLMREILDRTAKRISEELSGRPEVAVQLLNTIGNVYWQLGDLPRAETMANAALSRRDLLNGGRHVEVARSLNLEGNILYDRGVYPKAEAVHREALALRRELFHGPHRGLVASLNNVANALGARGDLAGAEALYREAVEMARKLNDDPKSLALGLRNLAMIRSGQGDYLEAETIILELMEILRKESIYEHPDTADALWLLAELRSNQGNLDEAEELSREALAMYRKLMGEEHPDQVKTIETMADLRRRRGDLTGAESSYREALAIQGRAAGDDRRKFATVLSRLSDVLIRQGKPAAVEELIEDILKTTGDPRARASLFVRRGDLRARNGRWSAAARDFARAVELDPENHEYYHQLAPLLVQSGDHEGYRRHCQRAVAQFRQTKHPNEAERMAKDCLILPDSGVDLNDVSAWAELAVTAGQDSEYLPWFQFAKALVEYRRGHSAETVEWAQKALSQTSHDLRDLQATAVLTMAQHRLGQADAARASLARADELEARLPRLESGNIGDGWLDWIIARKLTDEARVLIDGGLKPEPQSEKRISATPEARP